MLSALKSRMLQCVFNECIERRQKIKGLWNFFLSFNNFDQFFKERDQVKFLFPLRDTEKLCFPCLFFLLCQCCLYVNKEILIKFWRRRWVDSTSVYSWSRLSSFRIFSCLYIPWTGQLLQTEWKSWKGKF